VAKDNGFGETYVRVADLCSLTEAAERIGVSAMTIWGWAEAKLLRTAKIGTATVVNINDVMEVDQMMKNRKASIAGRTKKTVQPVNA